MSDQKNNLFSTMVEAAVEGSEAMSEDFSSWKKPLARTFFYFGTFIFLLLAIPFILPYKAFKKKTIDPYAKLRTELETVWCTESSHSALQALRDIHSQIISNFDIAMTKGFQIDSYGKFGFFEYTKVSHLLYHWELQHHNWDKANDICDKILSIYNDYNHKKSKLFAEWVVCKARVLNNLEGNLSAQEFLLKYIDPQENENPINTYLYELRRSL